MIQRGRVFVIVLLCLTGLQVWGRGGGSREWVAQPVAGLPATITADAIEWEQASAAVWELNMGSGGPRSGQAVELRALYDADRIAFRAQWSGPALAQETPIFSLLWRKDKVSGQRGESCHTACHHAFGDGQGGIKEIKPETVPAGRLLTMPYEAVWRDGVWSLTWSRTLRSTDALDIQFVDLSQAYPVKARLAQAATETPALLSERYTLKFGSSREQR